jgi:hypothetical protein
MTPCRIARHQARDVAFALKTACGKISGGHNAAASEHRRAQPEQRRFYEHDIAGRTMLGAEHRCSVMMLAHRRAA